MDMQRLSDRIGRRNPAIILEYAPFIHNSTCRRLYNDFNNRPIFFASEGKQKNGTFAPFRKFRTDPKNYRRFAILENTHLTFTHKYTHKETKARMERYPVLIVDIDDFYGDFSVFERYEILPNYLIRNPQNPQSLQVGYVLSESVFKEENKSFDDYYYTVVEKDGCEKNLPLDKQSKQVKFIHTVRQLIYLLNGDINFKLHNAKNPFIATEVGAICWTDIPEYDISDLHHKVDLYFNKVTNNEESKQGWENVDFDDIENHIETEHEHNKHYQFNKDSRNCSLFDEVRNHAYDVCDSYKEANDPKAFYRYIYGITCNGNEKYGLPLPEIKAMARGIVKFCFSHTIKVKYPSYQKRRLEKMSKAKQYMTDKFGVHHIYSKQEKEMLAKHFDVSLKTITVYISQIRKENSYRPANKNQQLAIEITALRNTTPPTKWARIAELLNMTENNVKVILHRYQKKL